MKLAALLPYTKKEIAQREKIIAITIVIFNTHHAINQLFKENVKYNLKLALMY